MRQNLLCVLPQRGPNCLRGADISFVAGADSANEGVPYPARSWLYYSAVKSSLANETVAPPE